MVIHHLTLAHSPDPDDAFMWWPLFEGRIVEPGLVFEQVTADIETLNRRAAGDPAQLLDITAMSCANAPLVSDRYLVTACGASVGEGYGPKLVAREPVTVEELRKRGATIAVPGRRTTAFMVLSIMMGREGFRPVELDFAEIEEAVRRGSAGSASSDPIDAGVVIHEGQLTFERHGLVQVADLGRWWRDRTELPLPLGVNAIRRDLETRLGPGSLERLVSLLDRSVRYAVDHREESLDRALRFARGIDRATAGDFVDLYVNRWTIDMGERGRRAVARLIDEAVAAGLLEPGAAAAFAPAPLHSWAHA